MDWTFSINQYDRDGDIIDSGVFIHVGDITTIKFKDVEELEKFCLHVLSSLQEIKSVENQ